jgi:hypothetical protein
VVNQSREFGRAGHLGLVDQDQGARGERRTLVGGEVVQCLRECSADVRSLHAYESAVELSVEAAERTLCSPASSASCGHSGLRSDNPHALQVQR